MTPYRKTQGSSRRETVRTAMTLCSAALFGATVLFIVNWHSVLVSWASVDAVNGALLALAVTIDAVLILSLIGLAARRSGHSPVRVTVPRDRPYRRR